MNEQVAESVVNELAKLANAAEVQNEILISIRRAVEEIAKGVAANGA